MIDDFLDDTVPELHRQGRQVAMHAGPQVQALDDVGAKHLE